MNNVLKVERKYVTQSKHQPTGVWVDLPYTQATTWEDAKSKYMEKKNATVNCGMRLRLVRTETTVMMESHPGG